MCDYLLFFLNMSLMYNSKSCTSHIIYDRLMAFILSCLLLFFVSKLNIEIKNINIKIK